MKLLPWYFLISWFDSDFSFSKHVQNVCKSCFIQLRDFRNIRQFLTQDAAVSFANAFVSSRLAYCNSLIRSLSKFNLHRLQSIQNSYKLATLVYKLLSGGYYGFRFVTQPQCVERFHCYRSNQKNIIASLLIFAGYIHNHKILHGNTFGLILKNKMAAMGIFSTFSKDFWWPSRAKGIIARDLKFARYVYKNHYKILTGNIFGLILKNKMAATGVSLTVIKSDYISLIIGPRVLGW